MSDSSGTVAQWHSGRRQSEKSSLATEPLGHVATERATFSPGHRVTVSLGHCNGQSMLEYAVLVGAVVAATVVMSDYVRRAFNAESRMIRDELNGVENSSSYVDSDDDDSGSDDGDTITITRPGDRGSEDEECSDEGEGGEDEEGCSDE